MLLQRMQTKGKVHLSHCCCCVPEVNALVLIHCLVIMDETALSSILFLNTYN